MDNLGESLPLIMLELNARTIPYHVLDEAWK